MQRRAYHVGLEPGTFSAKRPYDPVQLLSRLVSRAKRRQRIVVHLFKNKPLNTVDRIRVRLGCEQVRTFAVLRARSSGSLFLLLIGTERTPVLGVQRNQMNPYDYPLGLLSRAKRHLRIAMYWFTDKRVRTLH